MWVVFSVTTDGQSVTTFNQIKDEYTEGEEYLKEEDFKEALFVFLKINSEGYINPNLQYKIGYCYLKLPGQERKAIPYLEEATKHISAKYKRDKIEEKNAPLEALFYLGNAYRIDNQLDKALKVYDKFVNYPMIEDYNFDIVDAEIKACETAKAIQDKPVSVSFVNLLQPINSSTDESNPVISGNDSVMVFLRSLKLYNALFYSKKTAQGWSEPENINNQVLSDGEFYPTALSYDGNELFLVKRFNKNGDIYVSHLIDGKWGNAIPLNSNINTPKDENYACISKDGHTLYVSSNRRESKGGYDIFVANREADGTWGEVENIGKAINTATDEVCPYLSADNKTFYFSSKGHYNMGGYDIFYSRLNGKKWSEPQNIGFPINTTNDNVGFYPTGNPQRALMPLYRTDSWGGTDIYVLLFDKMPGQ